MAPPILTWALDGGERLASRLCLLYPREASPQYPLIRSLVEQCFNSSTIIVTGTVVMKSTNKVHYSNFALMQICAVLT
jgi:hypothetical protein